MRELVALKRVGPAWASGSRTRGAVSGRGECDADAHPRADRGAIPHLDELQSHPQPAGSRRAWMSASRWCLRRSRGGSQRSS